MTASLRAEAAIHIHASLSQVWEALIDPAIIKEYFFGAKVESDWQEGSAITWSGQWKGAAYEDKGTILKIDSEHELQYSHFSPMTGEEDIPENYHTVTIQLRKMGDDTVVTLTQDNNKDLEAAEGSKKNWEAVLKGLKKVVEK